MLSLNADTSGALVRFSPKRNVAAQAPTATKSARL